MHPHIYTAIAQQTQTDKKRVRCENKAANKMYIYIEFKEKPQLHERWFRLNLDKQKVGLEICDPSNETTHPSNVLSNQSSHGRAQKSDP